MLYKCTTFAPQKLKNALRMNTLSVRKQTSFRLNVNLLEKLQEEARMHNRSLNNLVESILFNFISKTPKKYSVEEEQIATHIFSGVMEANRIERGEAKGYKLDDIIDEL